MVVEKWIYIQNIINKYLIYLYTCCNVKSILETLSIYANLQKYNHGSNSLSLCEETERINKVIYVIGNFKKALFTQCLCLFRYATFNIKL